jgi:predicted amidohydrolase YtcJ
MTGLTVDIGRDPGEDVRGSVAPYSGWAGFYYDTGLPRERAKEVLLHCARNDIRAVMNSNSPGLFDLLDEVDREVPLKGRRWVLVHISLLSPRDIERIVRMGLVLTSHTNSNIYRRGHTMQAQLPPERHGENTPLRDLIDAGVKVALITDNVPISLFGPVWQSVARLSRTNVRIAPQQAITRAEALRCATENGAYLTFDEDKKGALEPGKLADLAVLSADPLTVAESGIKDISADMTMVGGKIVHQSTNWPA